MANELVHVLSTGDKNKELTAAKPIPAGTVLFPVVGNILPGPTMHTIQTGLDEHVDIKSDIMYTSHECCTANSEIRFHKKPWELVTVRDIEAGECICFDYVTTEYKMAEPFDCMCSGDCRKRVSGFHSLSKEEQQTLISEGKVSPLIKLLHEQNELDTNSS